MNKTLWAKLKSSGPISSPSEELNRIQFWIPVSLQPLVPRMREWMQKYELETSAEQRRIVENKAIKDISAFLRPHRHQMNANMLLQFTEMAHAAMEKSHKARLQAIEGDMSVEADFDEQLIGGLESWLNTAKRGENAAIAGWVERMLNAWQQHRRQIA